MQVRAISKGFYGRLREPGTKNDTFTLEKPEDFSEKWMVKAGAVEQQVSEPDEPEEKPLAKRPVAELREKAESRGIDHDGVSKSDLADLIEAHDYNPGEHA